MKIETAPEKKLFVLDTNVLMHDPASIYKFEEHNIFLPMMVLEELDKNKKGLTDAARNARQASRILEDLISDQKDILNGILISKLESSEGGRLYFQAKHAETMSAIGTIGGIADNVILNVVLTLIASNPDTTIILVSKDINMRIKSATLGICSQDYHHDQALDDISLLYTGIVALDANFWEEHGSKMESWREAEKVFYKLTGPLVKDWHPNQFLYMEYNNEFDAIVKSCDGETAVLQVVKNYMSKSNNVWGINAKNREQNFALNMLLDPNIDFVTILGNAGTGKTLLTLAAALSMILDHKMFDEAIMTRETIAAGEDIGFLPGDEKLTPWMGCLFDNLEFLGGKSGENEFEKTVNHDFIMSKVKIKSLGFMRGRTFINRFLIIDEAQNLTSKQMKTLVTRAGPGTKIVCLGNNGQIDTPYLTPTTSGLTYVVDKMKDWEHSGHIILTRGERSRLADYASDVL